MIDVWFGGGALSALTAVFLGSEQGGVENIMNNSKATFGLSRIGGGSIHLLWFPFHCFSAGYCSNLVLSLFFFHNNNRTETAPTGPRSDERVSPSRKSPCFIRRSPRHDRQSSICRKWNPHYRCTI